MPVKTQSEATEQVRAYAQMVAGFVGADGSAEYETGILHPACPGPGVGSGEPGFYAHGNYRMPLTVEHESVLRTMHDGWQAQGWTVTEFRMFTSDEGTLSVTNPADGVQVSVESARPATAVSVLIMTPCYTDPQ